MTHQIENWRELKADQQVEAKVLYDDIVYEAHVLQLVINDNDDCLQHITKLRRFVQVKNFKIARLLAILPNRIRDGTRMPLVPLKDVTTDVTDNEEAPDKKRKKVMPSFSSTKFRIPMENLRPLESTAGASLQHQPATAMENLRPLESTAGASLQHQPATVMQNSPSETHLRRSITAASTQRQQAAVMQSISSETHLRRSITAASTQQQQAAAGQHCNILEEEHTTRTYHNLVRMCESAGIDSGSNEAVMYFLATIIRRQAITDSRLAELKQSVDNLKLNLASGGRAAAAGPISFRQPWFNTVAEIKDGELPPGLKLWIRAEGGSSAYDHVKRVMTAMLSNELMSQMNRPGSHNKCAMHLGLERLIKDSAIANFSVSSVDVEKYVTKVLKYAKDWHGGREKRRPVLPTPNLPHDVHSTDESSGDSDN